MPITSKHEPLIDKLLNRSDDDSSQWAESAIPGEVFTVVDGHSFIVNNDPLEQISVKILDPKGRLVYSSAFQRSDPEFAPLERLYHIGRQRAELSAASNFSKREQAAGRFAGSE